MWGFLKYYHPGVAGGTIHWDSVLVATVPTVKAAATNAQFQAALVKLLDAAGPVRPCVDPASATTTAGGRCRTEFPDSMRINLDLRWLDDARLLGASVSRRLAEVRDNRHQGAGRYVSFGITAVFDGDTAYHSPMYPAEGKRLLGLFRFWNVARYYFPYMYVNGGDWNDVLLEFIPRMIAAKNAADYHFTTLELTTRLRDTHVTTTSVGIGMSIGGGTAPFTARSIEGQVVVWRLTPGGTADRDGVRVGDVITHIDGATIDELRQEHAKYIPAGNPATLERKLIARLLRSGNRSVMYTVERNGSVRTISVATSFTPPTRLTYRVTELAKVLPNTNFGYINMGDLNPDQVDSAYAIVKNTAGLVMDVRNYPRSTMYQFARLFNPTARPFVKFTSVDSTFPGQVVWRAGPPAGPPAGNPEYYRGRIAILADERTQSHAEFTVMALRTSPENKVIGSATAGADGNITRLQLPGGITTLFTGLGVFYPDGKETQRIGLAPDIEARPTLRGTRAGKDEVLDRALEYLRTGQ